MTGIRVMALVLGLATGLLALAGCPDPRMPEGPPPEYTDPPRPSWLEGGSPAAPATEDAGAPERR